MNIRTWVLLIVNTLLIAVVLAVSTTFYQQFKEALDERVLLQLTSIKRLKRIQIEGFLNRKWEEFIATEYSASTVDSTLVKNFQQKHQKTGIYDLTSINPAGKLLIGFMDDEKSRIAFVSHERVQQILLERTGMGNSGETYLVGADFRLRSQSRFFPEVPPYEITAQTIGVIKGMANEGGQGVFFDYRNVEVYSAYHPISIGNLRLVILSEMDVSEAMRPVYEMRDKLIFIATIILVVAIGISLYLTKIITKPMVEIRGTLQKMAFGDYSNSNGAHYYPMEVNEIFEALSKLQNSLAGAVVFSTEIGGMNLDSAYTPKSSYDSLGYSLIKMRDQLLTYREKELEQSISVKKVLMERQEAERKRLAMELHDDIGPLLTSLRLYVQNHIEEFDTKTQIKILLDDIISEVRLISYALAPASLVDLGVGKALSDFVFKMRQNTGFDISFEDLTHQETSAISSKLGINLFRICQELINNTLKHAQATKIVITLSEFENHLSLFYYDNGSGYNPSEITAGAGLINIKERVAIFSGLMNIAPECGNSTVEIEMPIK